MKIIGVIAEYNPFHLGHLYQIKKIKERYPDALIVAIISTHFTQRGEISLLNKWDKTKICLECGIDLVVELPTFYAIQSADAFAYGALKILTNLHIDTLVFGTESDNVEALITLANFQVKDKRYDKLVKKYLTEGINYPTATSKALYELTGAKIDKPNDLLALSYIKEIISNNYPITPISIKRTNDYHGKIIDNEIISANLIRELLKDKQDITRYVPDITLKYLNTDIDINNAYNYLKYNIINNKDKLDEYLMIDEGIENRIIKEIINANTWNELIMHIKTKRYTYNRISRLLMAILLNIKKTDNTKDVYIRILGFNQRGRTYLNKIKKSIDIPVYTGYKPGKIAIFDLEYHATCIYALITDNPSLIKQEYQNKPIF